MALGGERAYTTSSVGRLTKWYRLLGLYPERCRSLGEALGSVLQGPDLVTREAQDKAVRSTRFQASFGQEPRLHPSRRPDPGRSTRRRITLQMRDEMKALVRNRYPERSLGEAEVSATTSRAAR